MATLASTSAARCSQDPGTPCQVLDYTLRFIGCTEEETTLLPTARAASTIGCGTGRTQTQSNRPNAGRMSEVLSMPVAFIDIALCVTNAVHFAEPCHTVCLCSLRSSRPV
jgi:hypothetical protein